MYLSKQKVRSLVPPALLAALATCGMSDTIAFVDAAYPVARWTSREEEIELLQILIPNFQHSCIWVEGRSNFGTRASFKSHHQRGLLSRFVACNNILTFVAGNGVVAAEF